MKSNNKIMSAESTAKHNTADNGLVGTTSIFEAALNPHFNFITDRALTEAEKLFLRIKTGKEHALKVNTRDNNNHTVRMLRALISEANKNGDCIINDMDGMGYYRPDPNNPEEMQNALGYISAELSRAAETEFKAKSMHSALMSGEHRWTN